MCDLCTFYSFVSHKRKWQDFEIIGACWKQATDTNYESKPVLQIFHWPRCCRSRSCILFWRTRAIILRPYSLKINACTVTVPQSHEVKSAVQDSRCMNSSSYCCSVNLFRRKLTPIGTENHCGSVSLSSIDRMIKFKTYARSLVTWLKFMHYCSVKWFRHFVAIPFDGVLCTAA